MTFGNSEEEVKTRLAAVLWLDGVFCLPEHLLLSVRRMEELPNNAGSHNRVVVTDPTGIEHEFDHFPGYGFPRGNERLSEQSDEWFNEQARVETPPLEADPA